MKITIKEMETDEEIRGKAYVHRQAWHEAYAGIVSPAYLAKLTPEKCEELAFRWRENILIALDGDRVIGFAGFGDGGAEAPDTGELFALYVLAEYYGTGVGRMLLTAALERLKGYAKIGLWVLKENGRAIRFYEKRGFAPTGEALYNKTVEAAEIRMVLDR